MLGSANFGPSLYLVFTVIMSILILYYLDTGSCLPKQLWQATLEPKFVGAGLGEHRTPTYFCNR